jgi:undecaprenyl diphosphate synthase
LRALHGFGVEYVTLYAFSTENWGRPHDEVEGLLGLLQTVIANEVDELHKSGIRIRHLGVLDRLPEDLAKSISTAVELTHNNIGLNLCVAFDYGGRAEIVDAIRGIIASGCAPEDVTDELVQAYLYLPDIPDPDLIIRTAGEQRLSNFLIWQSAYSEYYQTPVYWPDFDASEVEQAVKEYKRRRRRFGALPQEG